MRECERILGAAGKTPSTPPATGPFAGFVRTSVEFFAAFDRVPVAVSPASLAGAVGEHYPGGNWRRLTTPLPSKKFPAGVAARRAILEALRVRFPADLRLTDDHLDACLGAVIAAAADGAIPGARVERCGAEIARDGARLREGPILVLRVDDATTARLAEAVRKVAPALPEPAPNGERAAKSPPPGLVRVGVTSRLLDSTQDAIAVEGLSHLNAKKEVRRRIGLPDYGGHLWLGDHGCFWAKHQLEDPVAIETYKRVRESLVFSPDDYDDVEAIIDDTTAHP
jgi:ketosteroid isomerase-like protein